MRIISFAKTTPVSEEHERLKRQAIRATRKHIEDELERWKQQVKEKKA